jgi:hypothetical protein
LSTVVPILFFAFLPLRFLDPLEGDALRQGERGRMPVMAASKVDCGQRALGSDVEQNTTRGEDD